MNSGPTGTLQERVSMGVSVLQECSLVCTQHTAARQKRKNGSKLCSQTCKWPLDSPTSYCKSQKVPRCYMTMYAIAAEETGQL